MAGFANEARGYPGQDFPQHRELKGCRGQDNVLLHMAKGGIRCAFGGSLADRGGFGPWLYEGGMTAFAIRTTPCYRTHPPCRVYPFPRGSGIILLTTVTGTSSRLTCSCLTRCVTYLGVNKAALLTIAKCTKPFSTSQEPYYSRIAVITGCTLTPVSARIVNWGPEDGAWGNLDLAGGRACHSGPIDGGYAGFEGVQCGIREDKSALG